MNAINVGFQTLAGAGLILAVPMAVHGEVIPIVTIDPATQVSETPGPGMYWGFHEGHANGMVGWAFTLLQPVTVRQIGWYDENQDGLSRSFQVGLWHNSTQLLGTPTAGIYIPGGPTACLSEGWRVQELPAPLELTPGNYTLGGLDSATTTDTIVYALMQNHETDAALTGSRLSIGAFFYAGMDGPTGFQQPSMFYLADGLELGPMLFIDVPEPGTLFVVGLGAAVFLARKCRQPFVDGFTPSFRLDDTLRRDTPRRFTPRRFATSADELRS